MVDIITDLLRGDMCGSFSSLVCNLIGLHGNMLNDLIRGDSLIFEHDIIKLTMPCHLISTAAHTNDSRPQIYYCV